MELEAQLEDARDRIELLEEELEEERVNRVEDLARQANILAPTVARVERAARDIDFVKGVVQDVIMEVGPVDDAAGTEAYEMMYKVVEDMNDAVAQLVDEVKVPGGEDLEDRM